MKNTTKQPDDFKPLSEKSKGLREDIMLCLKASDAPVTGEIFFKLIFMTESQLVKLAQSLHIKVT